MSRCFALALCLLAVIGEGFKSNDACPSPSKQKYGVACLCGPGANGKWRCGTYPEVPTAKGQALVVTSQADVAFMEPKVIPVKEAAVEDKAQMALTLDTNKTYQRILGFGGAFTDAVAYHYHRFNAATREGFRAQYWGTGSIGYTLGRVPMNSVDFSRMNYALHNVSGDTTLEKFCLRDDSATEVPCGTDYKVCAGSRKCLCWEWTGSDPGRAAPFVSFRRTWSRQRKMPRRTSASL